MRNQKKKKSIYELQMAANTSKYYLLKLVRKTDRQTPLIKQQVYTNTYTRVGSSGRSVSVFDVRVRAQDVTKCPWLSLGCLVLTTSYTVTHVSCVRVNHIEIVRYATAEGRGKNSS